MQDAAAKNKRPPQSSAALASAEVQKAAKTRVQDLARVLGNDEIVKRIEQGQATREQMLVFIAHQLGTIQHLQKQELDLTIKTGAGYEWWKFAQAGVKAPEPNRWHGPARAFEAATDALCRGDLARGQKLLEEAVRLQEEVTDEMTELVARQEAAAAKPDVNDFAEMVTLAPTTGACAEPLPIREAIGAILNVNADPHEPPDVNRILAPEWAKEEEEDEEPQPPGGGGGAG